MYKKVILSLCRFETPKLHEKGPSAISWRRLQPKLLLRVRPSAHRSTTPTGTVRHTTKDSCMDSAPSYCSNGYPCSRVLTMLICLLLKCVKLVPWILWMFNAFLSLTGTTFAWFTSLPSCSIGSWIELEERFYGHFYNGVNEMKLSHLTSVH
jgi:hypothetical protein